MNAVAPRYLNIAPIDEINHALAQQEPAGTVFCPSNGVGPGFMNGLLT